MKIEVKKLDLWSVTRVSFLVYVVVGFLIGILYAGFFAMLAAVDPSFGGRGGMFGGGEVAGIVIVLMPFLFALGAGFFYTLFTVMAVAVYNLAAGWVGGVEFTLGENSTVLRPTEPAVQPTQATVAPPAPSVSPGAPPPPPAPDPPAPPVQPAAPVHPAPPVQPDPPVPPIQPIPPVQAEPPATPVEPEPPRTPPPDDPGETPQSPEENDKRDTD